MTAVLTSRILQSATEIRDEMANFRKEYFDVFSMQQVAAINQHQANFKNTLSHEEEVLRNLANKEKLLKGQSAKLNEEYHKEQEIEAGLSERLDKLRSKERQLPDKISGQKKEIQTRKQQIEAYKNTLNEQEKSKQQLLNEVTKGTNFYKERLGLEFQRVGEQRLRLVFSQMANTENEVQPPCYFSLHIVNDVYTVEECAPVLPASVLETLVRKLNQTNEFGPFVKQMRASFKAVMNQQRQQ